MNVVVAIDAFKGCLSSADAGRAAAAGVRVADAQGQVEVFPVADGGEGTVDALLAAAGPHARRGVARTLDALGRPVEAAYALLDDGATAVVEAASCLGLTQVHVDATLPPRAGSAGLGLLVRHVLDGGARRVVVALGGTACTDGGTGMLLALGGKLRDEVGADITTPNGNPLWQFGSLDALPDLGGVELVALTDVDNPLHGPQGAAHVFGPQKGATPEQVAHLDGRLAAWGTALAEAGRPAADLAGAGAAGGIGAALLALGARREPGLAYVARLVGLDTAVADADLVLTGEGRIDEQTARGKTPSGVAALGRAAGAIVIALAGDLSSTGSSGPAPFDAVFAIHPGPRSLTEAMEPDMAARGLATTTAQIVRMIKRAQRR